MWWYANGKKMREAQFRDGDMDGEYLEWSPDGIVRVNETLQTGRKLATKTSYYTGGKVKKSEGMYLFAKDVEQSPDDWWNCKLQVTTVKTGRDEKHGAWTSWHPSGQPQLEGKYEHDVQVGEFTWWHSNGQQALQGEFARRQARWHVDLVARQRAEVDRRRVRQRQSRRSLDLVEGRRPGGAVGRSVAQRRRGDRNATATRRARSRRRLRRPPRANTAQSR